MKTEMSTQAEQIQGIRLAVEVAERRLKELDSKPRLTRAETYEREMTVECIRRGNHLLGKQGP